MSDILDNKSDAEIEEIYGRATMEDLQAMLIQEKCLNRRRLLRKVMRAKASNYPDNSISTEAQNLEYIKKFIKEKPLTDIDVVNDLKSELFAVEDIHLIEKLNQLRKQLNETVDLARRKELRKDIQVLENKCSAQENTSDDNCQNSLSKGNDRSKNHNHIENKNNIKEEPKPPLKEPPLESKEDKYIVNKSKVNFSKSANIMKSDAKTSSSQDLLNKNLYKTQHQTSNKDQGTSNTSNKTLSIQDSLNQNQIKFRQDAINDHTDNANHSNSETLLKETHKMKPSSREALDVLDVEYLNQPALNEINDNKSSFSQMETVNKDKPALSDNQKSILSKSLSSSDIKTRTVSPTVDSKSKERSTASHTSSPKSISNKLPTTPTKPNVSRVSSFRDKFENAKDANEHFLKGSNSQTRIVNQQHDKILTKSNTPKIGNNTKIPLKDLLLMWIQKNTTEYQNVKIMNYSKSWTDGLAFCALIHHFYPNSFDYDALSSENPLINFKLAFDTAKKYAGIEPLIDPEDMIVLDSPDEKCVFTYVQFMYKALKVHPRNMLKRAENPES